MKYTAVVGSPIEENNVRYLYLERSCKACCHKLTGYEKFCPQCGHKLLCIKDKVPEDYILSILNRKAEPGSVLVKPTDDAANDMAARQEDNVRTKANGKSLKEVKCM